jgi:hypothetical protein
VFVPFLDQYFLVSESPLDAPAFGGMKGLRIQGFVFENPRIQVFICKKDNLMHDRTATDVAMGD